MVAGNFVTLNRLFAISYVSSLDGHSRTSLWSKCLQHCLISRGSVHVCTGHVFFARERAVQRIPNEFMGVEGEGVSSQRINVNLQMHSKTSKWLDSTRLRLSLS